MADLGMGAQMSEWVPLSKLAKLLGVSRRTLDRALGSGGELETDDGVVQVERRDAVEADYEGGLRRQTKVVARVVPAAEVPLTEDGLPDVDAVMSGRGSAEASILRLERIFNGLEKRTYHTSTGQEAEGDFSDMAMLRAGSDAQKLREYIDERDRNYIPCDVVATAMVELASMLSHRLAAIPSRVAAEVSSDLREPLVVSVDEIRTELGDESERLLAEILGER